MKEFIILRIAKNTKLSAKDINNAVTLIENKLGVAVISLPEDMELVPFKYDEPETPCPLYPIYPDLPVYPSYPLYPFDPLNPYIITSMFRTSAGESE